MRVPKEHEAEIRRILRSIKCPHQTQCCDPDIRGPCHIRYLGDANLIECLDKQGRTCPFGVSFGYSIFCRCPVCKYLVQHDLHHRK